MKIAFAQVNPTVGDLVGNAKKIEGFVARARLAGADCVVFPELAVCGYPPRDLLYQRSFVEACARTVRRIGEHATAGLIAIIGTPLPLEDGGVSNSLVVYGDNAFRDYYDKRLLPTYDVFDEDRYFTAGDRAVVIGVEGQRIGLVICEDLWHGEDAGFAHRYATRADPVKASVEAGAQMIVACSASPFGLGKHRRHLEIVRAHARRHGICVCSVNQIGANDDLVFDGRACVVDSFGRLRVQGAAFQEDLLVWDAKGGEDESAEPAQLCDERNLVEALSLGVRDYVTKSGFHDVIIGLSGGIDSALTATIAVHALGAEHVMGVAMPGPYSSGHSVEDARELAERLGIRLLEVSIERIHSVVREQMAASLAALGERPLGTELPDIADQNLQSRARGTILMTLSNRTGALVLTTGNKSEVAVGYCTLYGDMNGALAVLSDVPKTRVFGVSRWINGHAADLGFSCAPIPERTIAKPPSAELAPDQLDTDSLPPYEVLDAIIEHYVEARHGVPEIIEQTGFEPELVRRIVRLIDLNEYKRKQLAIGLKVTSIAFGPGRRMPMVRGWC